MRPELVEIALQAIVNSKPTPKKESVDIACGTSPSLNQSQTNINQGKLDVSIGVGSDFPIPDDVKIDNSSMRRDMGELLVGNASPITQSLNGTKTTPSRLEVTLTAEPDQPIIVKVQGGEK